MRCEDYPCCGHTDGLPCDWTYTTEARAFDLEHAMCDHEAGFCEAYDDEGEPEWDCCSQGDANKSSHDGAWRCYYCGNPVPGPTV